jgi:hypothetical protein
LGTNAGMNNTSDDTNATKVDEEQRERYRELLEELRTILPGAQVLFAFLLTVPFSGGFAEVDQTGKVVYLVALASVAAATVLFFAPAAHHRVADDVDRSVRVRFGVRTQLVGLVLVAVGVAAGLFLVVRFLFDWRAAVAISGSITALVILLWVVRPLVDQHSAQ